MFSPTQRVAPTPTTAFAKVQACAAHAVARQCLHRGGSAGLLRPPAPRPGARDRPQAGRRDRAGLRAQDRRALDQPALREWRLHRRRHARRRHDRRGRHRQSAHGEGHPAQAEGQVPQGDRRARRDLHGAQGVPGDEQAPGGGWREGLRQSAQRRRGVAAPARCRHHREPAAALLRLCLGRGRAALMEDPQRVSQAPEGLGLQGQSAVQALPHARAGARILSQDERGAAVAALRHRRRRLQGRPHRLAGAPGLREPRAALGDGPQVSRPSRRARG